MTVVYKQRFFLSVVNIPYFMQSFLYQSSLLYWKKTMECTDFYIMINIIVVLIIIIIIIIVVHAILFLFFQ